MIWLGGQQVSEYRYGMILCTMLCGRVQLHQQVTNFAHGTLAPR